MLDFRHFHHLTDDIGMLQFSQHGQPDKRSGYTLDDNARALIVALICDFEYEEVAKFTRFLARAQQEDGSWSNFYLDNVYTSRFDSEDSIGRALLACAVGSNCKWDDISIKCVQMLKYNARQVIKFRSPRAIAYTLVGLCKKYSHPDTNSLNPLIDQLFSYLMSSYTKYRRTRWHWFEDYLTYCNGILPQAMLAVYTFNGNKKALKAGRESLDFLCSVLFRQGYLSIIGNDGWYHRGEKLPRYDQQPVDAASVMGALNEAYQAIGSQEYLDMMQKGYAWYGGENINCASLYCHHTGGCYDALTSEGVNTNQGAEAILSLLLTEATIQQCQQIKEEKTS